MRRRASPVCTGPRAACRWPRQRAGIVPAHGDARQEGDLPPDVVTTRRLSRNTRPHQRAIKNLNCCQDLAGEKTPADKGAGAEREARGASPRNDP